MTNYTHIIETFLWDRPHWKMPMEYLVYRLEFFHKYTLKSILNQTVKDFKIFLQLGNVYKNYTDKYPIDKRVTRCYNHGEEEYKKIDSDYLIINRIDTDDMFCNTAIDNIRRFSKFDKGGRTVSVFKRNLCWDMINNCIVPHQKATSPFLTHIYPKKLYKNWEWFKKDHFQIHGKAGDRQGLELPINQVLVTKHGQNVSHLKRGLGPLVLDEDQKHILQTIGRSDTNIPAYDYAVWDKEGMRLILKDFGVEYG